MEFEGGMHYLQDAAGQDVDPIEELPEPAKCVSDLEMHQVQTLNPKPYTT